MFVPYWPILALVVSLILVGLFLTLFVAEKICRRGGVRHGPLPERPLDTYLPDQDLADANVYEEFHLASAEIPPSGVDAGVVGPDSVQVHVEKGEGGMEPYDLDASMSPEGKREFQRY